MERPEEQPSPQPPDAQSVGLDPEAWLCVQRKARRLAAWQGFSASEREDLEQELALRLWRALPSFDPALGTLERFIATILRRAAASLIRTRCTQSRGRKLIRRSLHLLCEGEGEEVLAADAANEAMLPALAPEEEFVELAHDVAVVLETLPQDLKRLAQQLKHRTVSEIAQREGVSRSTLYVRIQQLRARFHSAGLEKIL